MSTDSRLESPSTCADRTPGERNTKTFDLAAVTYLASLHWPEVRVEPDLEMQLPNDPESAGHLYTAYVDDHDEPTWIVLDDRSDKPVSRQLIEGLIRVAEVHLAAAVGIAWHSAFLKEDDIEVDAKEEEPPEFVGLGLYDPSRPFARPEKLRGPFKLTEETLRFLVRRIEMFNKLLPARSDVFLKWGIFPWCGRCDEVVSRNAYDDQADGCGSDPGDAPARIA